MQRLSLLSVQIRGGGELATLCYHSGRVIRGIFLTLLYAVIAKPRGNEEGKK